MGLQVFLHHEVQSSLAAGQREQSVPTGPTPTPPSLFLLLPRATCSTQTAMQVGGAITTPMFQAESIGKLPETCVIEENEPGLDPEPLPKTVSRGGLRIGQVKAKWQHVQGLNLENPTLLPVLVVPCLP